ncbi:MAG TPA: chemotaxis protein CheW [Polyangiaceae bacterium]|nr:chemotaxis protein CheW [Polyangiaceae bacterium]
MPATSSSTVDQAGPGRRHAVVLCQVGSVVCALPLEHVAETLRPLPIETLSGTAHFVDGLSIIRGAPVPVVDLARLLGNATDEPRTRLVVVKIGERSAALAVGSVLGVRALESATVVELPPLLAGASSEIITAIGSLDARLLLVLETSRVLPESSWASLEGAES